ncbi:MAG: hypothetical protein WD048_06105 [Chitinophagales bacterium]
MKKQTPSYQITNTREERHFCSYLFAWFLKDKQKNLKLFFENHTHSSGCKMPDDIDYKNCKLFYEFTAIRELIHFQSKIEKDQSKALKTKERAEDYIFETEKGDAQKKKPDLAFYFKDKKTLVLIEAKFEEGFKLGQIEESDKYGEFLKEALPNEIETVVTCILGTEYYIDSIHEAIHKKEDQLPCIPSISWEKLTEIIEAGEIKDEIVNGLNYQKGFHPKAMKNWSGNV